MNFILFYFLQENFIKLETEKKPVLHPDQMVATIDNSRCSQAIEVLQVISTRRLKTNDRLMKFLQEMKI